MRGGVALDLAGYEARARNAVRAFWAGRGRGTADDTMRGFVDLIAAVARAHGLADAEPQREARLSVTTAQRYWYSSRSGLAPRDAGTLTEVNLAALGAIAALLQVAPGEI